MTICQQLLKPNVAVILFKTYMTYDSCLYSFAEFVSKSTLALIYKRVDVFINNYS